MSTYNRPWKDYRDYRVIYYRFSYDVNTSVFITHDGFIEKFAVHLWKTDVCTLVSDFILANKTFWRPKTLRFWSYQTWRNRLLRQRVPRACLDLPEFMMWWERAEAVFRTLTFRFPAKNPSRSILQELRQRRANDPVALIYVHTFRLKGCVLWIFVACYIFKVTNLFQSFQFIDLNSFCFAHKIALDHGAKEISLSFERKSR